MLFYLLLFLHRVYVRLFFDGERNYFYDALDRLIAIETEQLRLEYIYDAFNRRISKETFENKVSTGIVTYLWDDNLEIGSLNEEGYLNELRILGEGLGAEIKAALFLLINDRLYIPLHDLQGSIIALVDLDQKKIKESYHFSAFGVLLEKDPLSPWLFSSKRFEKETHLLYFGNRFYNPELCRWMTPDPHGYEDGPNLYAYVHNNPLTHCDPFGLFSWSFSFSFSPSSMNAPLLSIPFERFFKSPTIYVETNRKVRSCTFNLSEYGCRNLKGGSVICFINGINNTKDEALQSALYLSKLGGGVNIHVNYNSTGGIVDFGECTLNLLLGALTEPCILLKNTLLDWARTAPKDARFYLIAHSQGCIQSRNSLETLSPEVSQRVHVLAIAPGAFLDRKYCGSVHHYIVPFYRDIVPCFDVANRFIHKNNMTVLPSAPNTPIFDHTILSPTYVKTISDFIKNAVNQQGFE